MRKENFCYNTIVTVIMFLTFSLLSNKILVAEEIFTNPGHDKTSITIDILKTKKHLKRERPAVTFSHNGHVSSVTKSGRDCTTCHMINGRNRLSPKFKRLADLEYDSEMNLYHTSCVECHNDTMLQKKKSGPITCGGCHNHRKLRQKDETAWDPVKFDKYLHYSHVKANNEKCDSCHHEYNEKTRKLVYVKGNECSCSYCHTENESIVKSLTAEVESVKIESLKIVSHEACIGCHRNRKINDLKSGPINCYDCHGDLKKSMEKTKTIVVPRMDQSQPDTIFVKTTDKKVIDNNNPICMQPVPFDHKAHENYSNSCRNCHHSSFETCSKCHPNTNNKIENKENYVPLVNAMHQLNCESSCIGCHQDQQRKVECAGCHSRKMKETSLASSCNKCHIPFPPTELPEYKNEHKAKETTPSAEKLLNNRVFDPGAYDGKNLPESISISGLKDQYETVTFPHRKIVLSLLERVKNNKLATYFHNGKDSLCLGCHHNSPVSENPPACANCHQSGNEDSFPFKPKLVSAYHRQCLQCHNTMKLKKPDSRDCGVCHANKKQ